MADRVEAREGICSSDQGTVVYGHGPAFYEVLQLEGPAVCLYDAAAVLRGEYVRRGEAIAAQVIGKAVLKAQGIEYAGVEGIGFCEETPLGCLDDELVVAMLMGAGKGIGQGGQLQFVGTLRQMGGVLGIIGGSRLVTLHVQILGESGPKAQPPTEEVSAAT
jgi:hypothetical protein